MKHMLIAFIGSFFIVGTATSVEATGARVKFSEYDLETNWESEDATVVSVAFKRAERQGAGPATSGLAITLRDQSGKDAVYTLPAATAARHGLGFAEISKFLAQPANAISFRTDSDSWDFSTIIDFAFHDGCELDFINW